MGLECSVVVGTTFVIRCFGIGRGGGFVIAGRFAAGAAGIVVLVVRVVVGRVVSVGCGAAIGNVRPGFVARRQGQLLLRQCQFCRCGQQ